MLKNDLKHIIMKNKIDNYIIEPTNNYYDHITFSIDSLSDFIRIIEIVTTIKRLSSYYFFYRGMSNSCWQLEPSLMRKMKRLSFLEHDLAVEFNTEMPHIFKNANNNFEKIASMQHYGIPTRLLDFSLNPLIALYFACSENYSKDGRVVITNNKLNHSDNICVECISSLFLYENCMNQKIDDWLSKYNVNVSDFLFRIYTNIHGSSPLFVKPPYIDNRIKNQRSVFLLFNNAVRDLTSDCYYYSYKNTKPNHIKVENLSEIYKEQIQKPTLYSFEDPLFMLNKTTFERITDIYRKDDFDNCLENMEIAFKNRFYLHEDLNIIEKRDIDSNYLSIIIPARIKKKVLSQLNQFGINEGFVYPEGEHVAKIISKRYL